MARELTPPPFPPTLHINFTGIILAVIGLVLALGAFTSFYTVSADSLGVVQRFGRYKETVTPGLRFKIPFGVDQVTILPVERQLKLEFGFATRGGATNDVQFSNEGDMERNMVTGDLNAAQVEWVVQYRIDDPVNYLFNVREPGSTLRDVSESVMREVVGDRMIDEVLTIGRQNIETDAIAKLQALVQKLHMGVKVYQVQLKNVHPPGPVQRSFDEVNRAQQEKEEMINQANGEYNKVVPRAKGEAEQKISESEGYAIKRTNEAEGDVARFKALLEQYEKAPDITRQRLYLETMTEVIPNLGGKIILDEDAKQFLPLMQLQQSLPSAPRSTR